MTWAKQSGAAAKYRTAEHVNTRRQHMAQLKAAGQGQCAEPICVMPTRLITPDMGRHLHLCHDVTGTVVLGLGHSQCNIQAAAKEASRRSHARQARRPRSPAW